MRQLALLAFAACARAHRAAPEPSAPVSIPEPRVPGTAMTDEEIGDWLVDSANPCATGVADVRRALLELDRLLPERLGEAPLTRAAPDDTAPVTVFGSYRTEGRAGVTSVAFALVHDIATARALSRAVRERAADGPLDVVEVTIGGHPGERISDPGGPSSNALIRLADAVEVRVLVTRTDDPEAAVRAMEGLDLPAIEAAVCAR